MGPENKKDHLDIDNHPVSTDSTEQHEVISAPDSKTGQDESRPPLPPRTTAAKPPAWRAGSAADPMLAIRRASRQNLQSRPTTALSLEDINSQTAQDSSRDVRASVRGRSSYEEILKSKYGGSQAGPGKGSETADSASVKSSSLGGDTPVEVGSIFGDFTSTAQPQSFCDVKRKHANIFDHCNESESQDDDLGLDFESEFDSLEELAEDDDSGQYQN